MLQIDLKNQVAIVTGVSSGIGAGVAAVLAKAGCDVAGCSRAAPDSEPIKAFINSVKKEGRKAFYKSCDVTVPEQIEAFVKATAEHFGKIDFIISNAGVNVFKGTADCSLEDWDFNQKLNFRSHWLISKYSKPFLEKSDNGFVLVMTSNHAYSSIPGCFPYNSTKSGLTGLVNAMAIEWGPDIRVVGLAPGFIETKGGETWFNSFPDPKAEKEKTEKRHPAGKLGTVEEVGAFCAFLASDFAKFITGVTYLMDGGRSALMQDD